MQSVIEITIDRPIQGIEICDENEEIAGGVGGNSLGRKKAEMSKVCGILNGLVEKVNRFYEKLFVEHREAIARLSVEIARKILARRVEEGDYKIETVVKEAISGAPGRKELVVHLNPKDYGELEKLRSEGSVSFEGIKFVSDEGVGAAECVVESPKGTIKSLIDEHLERISMALENAG
jgi:flagellar biosynthesis/type III secretory pathway protein FliH